MLSVSLIRDSLFLGWLDNNWFTHWGMWCQIECRKKIVSRDLCYR